MNRALVALLLGAVLVGCGGSRSTGSFPSPVASAIRQSGAARQQAVVAAARAEGGSVTWYSAIDAGTTAKLAAAFTKATGIKVNVYRADAVTILQKLLAEHTAHRALGDVVETPSPQLVVLHSRGALQAYSALSAPAGSGQGDWTTDRTIRETITTNTGVVPQQPAAWEDLAAPSLAGKVCIEATDDGWYETLAGYWTAHGVSAATIASRFDAIAANARVITGHSAMGQLLSSGECGVAPQFTYITANEVASGSHLADTPEVVPAIDQAAGVAVIKSAPHPAGAVLFEDWLLGAGQRVLASAHIDGPAAGHQSDVFVDARKDADNAQAWTDAFQRVLNHAHAH